jgi:hypothetical protein
MMTYARLPTGPTADQHPNLPNSVYCRSHAYAGTSMLTHVQRGITPKIEVDTHCLLSSQIDYVLPAGRGLSVQGDTGQWVHD